MSAPHLHPLTWDSDYLGFGVARLEANQLTSEALNEQLAEARAAGLRLLYLVAAPADARSNASAQAAGAWLADRKVTFAMPVDPAEQAAALSPAIRPHHHLDAPTRKPGFAKRRVFALPAR